MLWPPLLLFLPLPLLLPPVPLLVLPPLPAVPLEVVVLVTVSSPQPVINASAAALTAQKPKRFIESPVRQLETE